jgi:threonine dehydratase
MNTPREIVDLAAIRAAYDRIRPHVLRTPVLSCPALSEAVQAEILLKCENMQHGGAFKARGATNAVLSLAAASAGVVTHSSGNHAAALARAARLRGMTARIVMPSNSRPNKLEAVRRLGVEPTLCQPTAQARQETADRIMRETGAVMIHPYDHPDVIAGQGTVALELLDQIDPFDDLIVPVGGGGLLAGCLIAVKTIRPDIRVIAAEPELADDAFRSRKSGRIEPPLRYDTIADGLRTPLGNCTFPIIQQLVDDIVLVDEQSILRATSTMLEVVKLVAEPSGAVPLACVLQHADRFRGRRVCLVVSGGNLDFSSW